MKTFCAFLITSCLVLVAFDAMQGKIVLCAVMLLCALINIFTLMNHMDGGRPA